MALPLLLYSLVVFAFGIVPRVRIELRAWKRLAQTIPDPTLRSQALDSLSRKAANAEAAAVFSTLVSRRRRREVVALLVALQVLTDFLDTVSEVEANDPLRNGLALHEALVDAVRPRTDPPAHFGRNPQQSAGGEYVAQLVAHCQQGLHALPSRAAVSLHITRAARRCGEGQSYTHDAIHLGPSRLAAWAATLARGTTYFWWEAAAGASSSVAVHALVAAAADPRTTRQEAARVDAAYFLGVGSLTVLLDNLVDREEDALGGGHNYLAYYDCSCAAASRLAFLVRQASDATRVLPQHRQHQVILAGVLGFYLSAPGACTTYAHPIKRELLAHASPAVWPVLLAMRARRWIGD